MNGQDIDQKAFLDNLTELKKNFISLQQKYLNKIGPEETFLFYDAIKELQKIAKTNIRDKRINELYETCHTVINQIIMRLKE